MIRPYLAAIVIVTGMALGAPARADEFGARFGGTAPVALGSEAAPSPALMAAQQPSVPDPAQGAVTPQQLENIVPAAGGNLPSPEQEPSDAPVKLESGLERDSGYGPNDAPLPAPAPQ